MRNFFISFLRANFTVIRKHAFGCLATGSNIWRIVLLTGEHAHVGTKLAGNTHPEHETRYVGVNAHEVVGNRIDYANQSNHRIPVDRSRSVRLLANCACTYVTGACTIAVFQWLLLGKHKE